MSKIPKFVGVTIRRKEGSEDFGKFPKSVGVTIRRRRGMKMVL